jgi:hypothetical protein
MDRAACTEPQCLYKGALYLYLPAVAGSPLDHVQSLQLRRTESPNPPAHSATATVLTVTTKETPCTMK